jgi:pseudouridine synthase
VKSLDRLLSRAGVCSRTAARAWIAAGRVRVNGAIPRSAEQRVDPRTDAVTVDGKALTTAAPLYLALNKPKGYVTTLAESESGERTVRALLEPLGAWVFPVGRLDRDTNGLLLLTNDTAFADRVLSPESKLSKLYRVRTRARVTAEQVESLRSGVDLEDGRTLPARCELVRDYKGYGVLELELVEGRNRQVRRMLKAVGNAVKELRRVAVGPVRLGDLASGAIRPLTREERSELGLRAR